MDGSEKRRSFLGVPCSDTPPLLQKEKGVFHQVSEFVEVFVVVPLVFAIFLGRNDYFHLFLPGLPDNRVGIIGAIAKEIFGVDPLYKTASLCAIRRGTFRDKSSDRHAMRIHGQMNLGVKPPFVRPMS